MFYDSRKTENIVMYDGQICTLAKISNNTLMFVDDPAEALTALFEHPDEVITDSSYVKAYKKIKYKEKDNDKSVGETKAETHLGTLRIYGLVEQIPSMSKGNNRLTITGKLFHDIWKKEKRIEKNEELKKMLADLILNNTHKKKIYENFLRFLEKEKTIEEIVKKYKWRTSYTLIAWCKLVDLISLVGNKRYKRNSVKKTKREISIENFWKEVRKAYEEIRKIDYDKKRLIVDFYDLRLRVVYNLHLSEPRDFNVYFKKLMKTKYNKFINLHGGIVGDFDPIKNFEYKGRLYPYMSLSKEVE